LQTGQQIFQATQADKDRALQQALQSQQFSFQGSQSDKDRSQQLLVQSLQEQGLNTRQATQVAADQRAQASQQAFQATQSGLDRAQQLVLQDNQLEFTGNQSALDRQQQTLIARLQESGLDTRQATQIASAAAEAAKDRALKESEDAKDRALQTALQTNQFTFQGTQAEKDRQQQLLVQTLQENGLNSRQSTQIAAEQKAQASQQTFQASQANLDRTQQAVLQDKQFTFQGTQAEKDRQQQLLVQKLQETGMDNRQATQIAAAASEAAKDRNQAIALQNDAQAFQESQLATQQTFTAIQAGLDRTQQISLQNDAQAFQESLNNSQIPAQFAMSINSGLSQSVNAIAADANLSGTVDGKEPAGSSPKSRAIQSAINFSNSQISWANTFYNSKIPQVSASGTTNPSGIINTASQSPTAQKSEAYKWAEQNGGVEALYNRINDFMSRNPSAAEVNQFGTQFGVSNADFAAALARRK
jgi:molybdopterin biosynthesis enzyme MoaB